VKFKEFQESSLLYQFEQYLKLCSRVKETHEQVFSAATATSVFDDIDFQI